MPVALFPAVVTQLGECQTEDLEVAGSSPAHRTIITLFGCVCYSQYCE